MANSLEERLNAETARLIGRPLAPGEMIGIAVSGGADSMALLSAAVLCWPGQVAAATVDHCLRAEARDEAAMVAHWCHERDVPHATLVFDAPPTGNLQASAREGRYALLESWQRERGVAWLMTAHQADDQLETLLLRVNRGAGVAGLASVRARRGTLLRPLLGVRRSILRHWCTEHDVPFVDDPSNENVKFDRVRMRKSLDGIELVDPAGLARSVEALADADAAIGWATEKVAVEALVLADKSATLIRTDLPPEILRRLVSQMIEHLHPEADKPRGPSLDQALVQLFDGKTVALADCVVTGGKQWTMRRAPPRKAR